MRLFAISTILISLTSTLAYAGAKCGNGVRGPRCGNGGGFTFADGGFTSGGFSSGNNFVSFGSGTPVGSVVQLGVTNPNGEPSGQIRIVRDEFGRNVFQALDVFGNVIAQTLSFIQGTNQPFFDENTGLSRDGRQRLFAGASNAPSVSTVSTTGTTGSTATAAEIQPAKLVEIPNQPGLRGRFEQQRPGEANATIEVVNVPNFRVFQRVGNQFSTVFAQPGDLVVRNTNGTFTMVDSNVRDELARHYSTLTNAQLLALGGNAINLINLIRARNTQLGSTGGSNPGGHHGTGGTTGSTGTGTGTGRPVSTTPAKTKFQTFAEKFESIADGPANVDGFIEKWGFKNTEKPEDKTQHAVVQLECVSPGLPNDITKMALFLSREKVDDKWIQKVRLEKEFTFAASGEGAQESLGSAIRADQERNRGQQSELTANADLKLHRATRAVKPYSVDYDLKIGTTPQGTKAAWVSINTKVEGFESKHFCRQDGLPLKKTPNTDTVPPAAARAAEPSTLAEDAVPADFKQVSEKDAKLKAPALLAEDKCASCHTGNGAEGGFVIGKHGISSKKYPTKLALIEKMAAKIPNMVNSDSKLDGAATQAQIDELRKWVVEAAKSEGANPDKVRELETKMAAAVPKA